MPKEIYSRTFNHDFRSKKSSSSVSGLSDIKNGVSGSVYSYDGTDLLYGNIIEKELSENNISKIYNDIYPVGIQKMLDMLEKDIGIKSLDNNNISFLGYDNEITNGYEIRNIILFLCIYINRRGIEYSDIFNIDQYFNNIGDVNSVKDIISNESLFSSYSITNNFYNKFFKLLKYIENKSARNIVGKYYIPPVEMKYYYDIYNYIISLYKAEELYDYTYSKRYYDVIFMVYFLNFVILSKAEEKNGYITAGKGTYVSPLYVKPIKEIEYCITIPLSIGYDGTYIKYTSVEMKDIYTVINISKLDESKSGNYEIPNFSIFISEAYKKYDIYKNAEDFHIIKLDKIIPEDDISRNAEDIDKLTDAYIEQDAFIEKIKNKEEFDDFIEYIIPSSSMATSAVIGSLTVASHFGLAISVVGVLGIIGVAAAVVGAFYLLPKLLNLVYIVDTRNIFDKLLTLVSLYPESDGALLKQYQLEISSSIDLMFSNNDAFYKIAMYNDNTSLEPVVAISRDVVLFGLVEDSNNIDSMLVYGGFMVHKRVSADQSDSSYITYGISKIQLREPESLSIVNGSFWLREFVERKINQLDTIKYTIFFNSKEIAPDDSFFSKSVSKPSNNILVFQNEMSKYFLKFESMSSLHNGDVVVVPLYSSSNNWLYKTSSIFLQGAYVLNDELIGTVGITSKETYQKLYELQFYKVYDNPDSFKSSLSSMNFIGHYAVYMYENRKLTLKYVIELGGA